MQVVIIGAGIIGASVAYALSRAGATVTVVDASGPAGGATGASFGWVNASFYADAAHFALRSEGIAAYRRLCGALDLPVTFSGCLCWEEQGAALEAQAAALETLGYAVSHIDGVAMRRREPAVKGVAEALFFEREAAVDPVAFTQTMLAASGARRIYGTRVSEIVLAGDKIAGVRVPGGVMACDAVIVAGGTGAPGLLEPLGVALPMLRRPGVILRSKPLPPTLNHICVAPIGEFRQLPDGRILMPTAVAHQADASEGLDASPDVLAEAAMSRLRRVLPDVPLDWEEVALAERPVPEGGLPVIGACGPQGLYTAVMHSGITLAPVVAEILAAEVTGQISNAQAALVAHYRPDRFQSG